MPAAYQAISQLGETTITTVAELGRFVRFSGTTFRWFFLNPKKWMHWRLLAPQFYMVGVASIAVVGITGAFIGMVLAIEMIGQFRAWGQEGRLGGVINISVTKQIGPVLAAVMVAGRVGCALAAELGTMRVTEQLDAMRAMAADPIPYLVVPRFVACLIMTPVLTIYSNMLGVFGGYIVTVGFYQVSAQEYWDFSAQFINWWEPTSGLIKSFFFGGIIGLIACYRGFHATAGAAGVGRAATEAFVASFLAIIGINLLLAHVLNEIGHALIYGGMGQLF